MSFVSFEVLNLIHCTIKLIGFAFLCFALWIILQILKLNCTTKTIECDESKVRAVCGTDNQTYATRCHLMRAQCAGHKVNLKHRGPCKGKFSISISIHTFRMQYFYVDTHILKSV